MSVLLSILRKVRPASLGFGLARLLGMRRREFTLPSGVKLYLDPMSELGAAVPAGTYEPVLSKAVVHLMKDGGVFVDVGANEGYFSILAASANPAARVIAFEPQPDVAAIIVRNAAANGLSNLQVHSIAVADAPGKVDIVLARHSGGTHLASVGKSSRFERRVSVPADTLDNIIPKENIRLMKMDCEGAELLVVRGARQLIQSGRVDFIVVDYHPAIAGPDAVLEIDRALRANRYLCSSLDGLWIYHLPGRDAVLRGLGELTPVHNIGAPPY